KNSRLLRSTFAIVGNAVGVGSSTTTGFAAIFATPCSKEIPLPTPAQSHTSEVTRVSITHPLPSSPIRCTLSEREQNSASKDARALLRSCCCHSMSQDASQDSNICGLRAAPLHLTN